MVMSGYILFPLTLLVGLTSWTIQFDGLHPVNAGATVTDSGCYELSPPFYGALVNNGSWIGAGQTQPEWQINDTVTFLCDRGYELVNTLGISYGLQWSITCEQSSVEESGSSSGSGEDSANNTTRSNITLAWSQEPQQFRCSRINCGQPPPVINASVSVNTTDLFSIAQYTCSDGYELSGGLEYAVCWWNGMWYPENISCNSIPKCGDPPTINNGDRIWIAGDQANVGTMVTYECDSGFEIEGGSEIACTDSGQWTTPPSCTATAALSSTEIYIVEGAGAAAIIVVLLMTLVFVLCYICRIRIKQRRYVQDEEALANSGAFTLSNPLVTVKDEDAAGNPLYLTPDELNEFEQQQ